MQRKVRRQENSSESQVFEFNNVQPKMKLVFFSPPNFSGSHALKKLIVSPFQLAESYRRVLCQRKDWKQQQVKEKE